MPRSCRIALSAWKTSAPARTASRKDEAPIGATMYSCISAESVACLPPLRMFIIGTGRVRAIGPPR
jgi:hypothetical protein